MSPWAQPFARTGRDQELWEAERDGPDEEFTMTSEVVAVDGDVPSYAPRSSYAATGNRWRDLWVAAASPTDGRC